MKDSLTFYQITVNGETRYMGTNGIKMVTFSKMVIILVAVSDGWGDYFCCQFLWCFDLSANDH